MKHIAGLEHPGEEPYSIAEYKNMAGRAGRLGFTPKGKSFVVASSPAEAHHLWNTYILGKPEALVSRFSGQEPLSLICRVLATANASKTNGLSELDLTNFIQSTFAGHQKGITLSASDIGHAIARLSQSKIIEKVEDRYRLTELGKIAGELGIHVESIVRISRALHGLPTSQMTDGALLAVSERSQPASRERMKTSHFEERIAFGAVETAQRRDESTQRELATFDNDLGGAWLVAPADCA